MGELFGRLVTGAIWGAAAGAALVFGKEGGPGLRTAAKRVMKGYVAAEEKVSEVRDSLDDLYAEARGGSSTTNRPTSTSKRVPIEHEPSASDEPGSTNDRGPGAHRSGNGTSHASKSQRSRSRA